LKGNPRIEGTRIVCGSVVRDDALLREAEREAGAPFRHTDTEHLPRFA
jgi:hypothetical protein